MAPRRKSVKGGNDVNSAPAAAAASVPVFSDEHQQKANIRESVITEAPIKGGAKSKKGGFVNLAPFITALSLLGIQLLKDKNYLASIGLKGKVKGGEGEVAYSPESFATPQDELVGGAKKRSAPKKSAKRKGGEGIEEVPAVTSYENTQEGGKAKKTRKSAFKK
jgi:hypothetical protein